MSAFLDWMKAQGAPEDVLREAEQSTMLQSDYTKKTQELADQQRQMLMYLGRLQGQQQQEPKAGPLQQYLAQYGDGEEGAAIRDIVGPGLQAVLQEVDAKYANETSRLKQALLLIGKQNEVKGRLERDLIGEYGDGVKPVLAKVEDYIQKELQAGRAVNPEQALWQVAPQEARKALQEKETRAQETRTRETMSGFESVRRTQPAMSHGGQQYQPPLNDGRQQEGSPPAKPASDDIDFSKLYAEIREEVPAA